MQKNNDTENDLRFTCIDLVVGSLDLDRKGLDLDHKVEEVEKDKVQMDSLDVVVDKGQVGKDMPRVGSLVVVDTLVRRLVVEDNCQAGSLGDHMEMVVVVVVRIGIGVADMVDPSLTFLGPEELPLDAFQIFHLVCPFQLCVGSAKCFGSTQTNMLF